VEPDLAVPHAIEQSPNEATRACVLRERMEAMFAAAAASTLTRSSTDLIHGGGPKPFPCSIGRSARGLPEGEPNSLSGHDYTRLARSWVQHAGTRSNPQVAHVSLLVRSASEVLLLTSRSLSKLQGEP